jgi:glutamyl-Q tRNA(Asp) synthetase
VGRFAPSPTGPLHFGSLLAAVGSYLQARSMGGKWLLRIEDIDPPREQPESVDQILRALEAYGFEWDGEVSLQSTNREAQDAAAKSLLDRGLAYHCGCSRRDLANERQGKLGTIYPGNCRDGFGGSEYSIRVRTDTEPVVFEDRLQGPQSQSLESESGDFVIVRRDSLIAYQLAVVVDDNLQDITEVVRGIDLLDSTPRQIWLQRLLGFPTPAYMHIPVAVNAAGQKLSKSTGAAAIPVAEPRPTLLAALQALRQTPAGSLDGSTLPEIWRWAIENWNPAVLTRQQRIRTADFAMD